MTNAPSIKVGGAAAMHLTADAEGPREEVHRGAPDEATLASISQTADEQNP